MATTDGTGSRLFSVSGGPGAELRVEDLATNSSFAVPTGAHRPLTAGCLPGDAAHIISAGYDGGIRLLRIADGAESAALMGHVGRVYSLAVSPDGRRLVSGGNDETIRLWDTASHEPVAVFRGHTSYVHCVTFSPDGTQLVSASGDGTVHIWDSLPPEQRTKQIRQAQALRRDAGPLVDRLLQELSDPLAVADALRTDPTLAEPLRQQALIVLLRRSSPTDPGKQPARIGTSRASVEPYAARSGGPHRLACGPHWWSALTAAPAFPANWMTRTGVAKRLTGEGSGSASRPALASGPLYEPVATPVLHSGRSAGQRSGAKSGLLTCRQRRSTLARRVRPRVW